MGEKERIGLATALGMLIQFLLYVAPADAWYLPNGSAIPAPLRELQDFPKCKAFSEKFFELPEIAAYYKTSKL